MAAWRNSEFLRKNYRLVCFGGPPPTPEEAALPGDVKFLRGDDLALANAYRQASALIYPSLYEGFGLPLLEAFNLDCPVVTSGCGSIREVAGEAAQYFEAASPDSLVEALRRVLGNVAWRETLTNRGRDRAATFSWKRCAEATAEAYRVALAMR